MDGWEWIDGGKECGGKLKERSLGRRKLMNDSLVDDERKEDAAEELYYRSGEFISHVKTRSNLDRSLQPFEDDHLGPCITPSSTSILLKFLVSRPASVVITQPPVFPLRHEF